MKQPLAGALACLLGAATAIAGPAITDSKRLDLSAHDRERVQAVTQSTIHFEKPESFEASQGGAGTSRKPPDRNAFSQPAENLGFDERERFNLGNALFRKLWVSSPSSTLASDGLGPLFNARACQNCHVRDGRGHPPEGGDDITSLVIRLATAAHPDPVYGGQIQDRSVPGLPAEGTIGVHYSEQPFVLPDGTIHSLRHPSYDLKDLQYGPLHADTTLSPRVAPPMIGLGLIEAIHPADIAAHADPDDRDGDGISGRISMVRDPLSGKVTLGRFGWKASQPSIKTQNAAAFSTDIGISTPLRPAPAGDCTDRQPSCLTRPHGVQDYLGPTEAPDPILDLVTFYTAHLAVPRRRNVGNREVMRGKSLFYDIGCTDCHRPKFVTRRDTNDASQAFQLIWPYSDFLLHDMGPSLADGQLEGSANGREWRTPPLWGIGLTKTVSGHTFFLHDGRARNLTEAILWHGGEAEQSRDRFASLSANDREALIAFLNSL